MSRLAIAAFASSSIVCLPPASALGIGLAIVALIRHARSPTPTRGRALALAAMVLGGVGLIGQALVMQWHHEVYHAGLDAAMVATLESAIVASVDGDATQVRQMWSASVGRPSVEAVAEFGALIDERYGRVRAVSIVGRRPGRVGLTPTLEVGVTLTFERRTLVGGAVFGVLPTRVFGQPEVRLRSMSIDDAQHDRLSLP